MSLGSGQTFHVRINVRRNDGYQKVEENEIDRMPSFADKQGAAAPNLIRMMTR